MHPAVNQQAHQKYPQRQAPEKGLLRKLSNQPNPLFIPLRQQSRGLRRYRGWRERKQRRIVRFKSCIRQTLSGFKNVERYAPLLRDAGVLDDPYAIEWAASEKRSTFTIAEINKILLSEGKGVLSALTEVHLLEALRGI